MERCWRFFSDPAQSREDHAARDWASAFSPQLPDGDSSRPDDSLPRLAAVERADDWVTEITHVRAPRLLRR